jgi:hypothetical protein
MVEVIQIETDETIRRKAKPLHEFVALEYFRVIEVTSQTYDTRFTPVSEAVFGGRSPEYSGGYTSVLELKVEPLEPKVPIRTLRFNGICAAKGGDKILAAIPKYHEREVFKTEGAPMCSSRDITEKVYLPRQDYKEEEQAVEIILLTPELGYLRTDRSIEFEKFRRPNEK